MRRSPIVALPLLLCPLAASADVRERDGRLELYSPHVAWAVTVPQAAWKVGLEKRRPDGTGFYYMVERRDDRAMAFSIYLDKTTECASAVECRERWARSWQPLATAKGVRRFERNGFAVVQFALELRDVGVTQLNLSAHQFRDGHWIDIRLSTLGKESDADALLQALDAFDIR